MRLLNRGGFANPDVLLVPQEPGPPVLVKDYSGCPAPVRWLIAPWLVRHELAILRRVAGLPGVPAPRGRVDRLALAMEYIDAVPLRRKSHRATLPRAFFDALEGILEGLALRGVCYLDLRSPSNVLWTRATGAPALVDLASASRLPVPGWLARAIERSALGKLRARFEQVEGSESVEPELLEHQELHLGSARICFLDRGRWDDPVPVLCLHDAGHSSEVFRSILEHAAAHGRRAIALDLPGFGGSSLRMRGLSPDRVAAHVAGFVDALRLARIDLLGFGWGGLVARVLAVRRPQLVRALLTLDTPLARSSGGFHRRWLEARRAPEVLRRRLLRELPPGVSGELREGLERAIQTASARALRMAYAGLEVREYGGSEPTGELELIGIPVPEQPWLAVSSDAASGSDSEQEISERSLRIERWSVPLADASRFWKALETLAQS